MKPTIATKTATPGSLDRLVRTRIVEFWGRRYRVTPRLVNEVLGDGKQLIWFEPLATRPDYYVIRVDSKWDTRNTGENPLCDHLEEIFSAIEDQFGRDVETYEHDNGRTYTKNNQFPALHLACGESWDRLKES